MPSKKKKYNARFPAGRIKKIMQSDEEVGKVAQAVPVIISRTLELFVESLLTKTLKITNSRNAKTLSPSHMKQCIMSENRFDFLRELVKYIPDISIAEESGQDSSPGPPTDNTHGALDYRLPSTSSEANMSPINGVPLTGNGTTDSIKDYSNSNLASHSKTEQKRSLKRQWEGDDNLKNFNKSLRSLRSKENTVSSQSTQSLESSPPKLSRMDSAPVASLDLSKDSKKRLMHQSKSVPCASKEEHPPLPAVPAPIVDISICNKPIVKIDYSNLILPEKDSSSGSSSDQNSSNTCISPVIKIDLSKITTQPRSNLQAISMSTTSVKSSFELDEDYDNI